MPTELFFKKNIGEKWYVYCTKLFVYIIKTSIEFNEILNSIDEKTMCCLELQD